jgi:threonyl-tRNA synthetase
MKILLIHSDHIEFEAKQKAIKVAEDWKKGEKTKINECLVVFTAVEKKDEGKVIEVTRKMISEVIKIAGEVKAKKIVFYPYAHLSKDLSSPSTALEVLKKAEELAKEKGFESYHAPFGWYKAFEIKAKGHPLSELSREISAEKEMPKKQRGGKQPVIKEDAKELSENDHRLLGRHLDLYSFNEIAPGMVFFHPKGMIIRNELMNFSHSEHAKRGYMEIATPVIMNKSLWETSGHWDHYKENMFFTRIDGTDFAVKPMNCPGSILVFKSQTRSYRDLPLRLSEYGMVHRNELSGVLSGLFRVRQFTQDDAHIFAAEDDLEKEIENVVDIIGYFYKTFGFDYHVELSTMPDDAMGSKKVWEKAENALEKALKKKKMKYKVNPKDGAFYGPKIDFHIKDSLGRTWQCATCQVDFMMPERFDINYMGKDNKQHRPVIIHRVIYGALERFIGILVEHYKGSFPFWISPVQVRILPLSEKNNKSAEKVLEKLKEAGFRADSDIRSSTVEYRVREAELQKVNYILVVGDKEEKSSTIAVRPRGSKKINYGVSLDNFIKDLEKEISEKK